MFIENEEIFIALDEIIRRYEDVIRKMDTKYVTKKGQEFTRMYLRFDCIFFQTFIFHKD